MTSPTGKPAIDDVVVHSQLEDGRAVCIRAIRASDEDRMRSGIGLLSDKSRYLRFFSPAPSPPDAVISRLVGVDGHRHLGWGAILSEAEGQPAIGAVHAVRDNESSEEAEFAIAVLDAYHGLGLARMLIAVLMIHCRCEGIETIGAQVLFENTPAARLLQWLGARRTGTDQGISDYELEVETALQALRAEGNPPGLGDVFAAFKAYL